MYTGLFSEWNTFHSDITTIPYSIRIYPMYEFNPVYYTWGSRTLFNLLTLGRRCVWSYRTSWSSLCHLYISDVFLRDAARGICTRASLSGQFLWKNPFMYTFFPPIPPLPLAAGLRFFASTQTFANDISIFPAVTSLSLFQLRVPGKHCLDGNCTVGMTNEEFCEIPRTSWEWDIPDR